jgi:hypothetical protein
LKDTFPHEENRRPDRIGQRDGHRGRFLNPVGLLVPLGVGSQAGQANQHRGGQAMKRTPIRRVSKKLSAEKKEYTLVRALFLEEHPLCQVSIREAGMTEEHVLECWRRAGSEPGRSIAVIDSRGKTRVIPPSRQIHHRNKRHGTRLTDVRWFLSVSIDFHAVIEQNLSWARSRGYSLDISCDPDGFTPAGVQALTTDQLMQHPLPQ